MQTTNEYSQALEVLAPFLPIKTVRVSSAQASGRAKQYAYWGTARYQLRAAKDGSGVVNMPLERANSDRRSVRLAESDARSTNRLRLQTIGKLGLSEALAVRDELVSMLCETAL